MFLGEAGEAEQDADAHTDDAVNEMIARTEAEIVLFTVSDFLLSSLDVVPVSHAPSPEPFFTKRISLPICNISMFDY